MRVDLRTGFTDAPSRRRSGSSTDQPSPVERVSTCESIHGASPSADMARGEPSPSADVARGEHSPSADFARAEPSPSADVARGEPSPSADVARGEKRPSADVARGEPTHRQMRRGAVCLSTGIPSACLATSAPTLRCTHSIAVCTTSPVPTGDGGRNAFRSGPVPHRSRGASELLTSQAGGGLTAPEPGGPT
jgi:hypothetical protein